MNYEKLVDDIRSQRLMRRREYKREQMRRYRATKPEAIARYERSEKRRNKIAQYRLDKYIKKLAAESAWWE